MCSKQQFLCRPEDATLYVFIFRLRVHISALGEDYVLSLHSFDLPSFDVNNVWKFEEARIWFNRAVDIEVCSS